MIVIGGGVIGLEMGSVYARLGTEVTVVEFAPKLIPTMDGTLSKELQKVMKKLGMKINTNTKVSNVSRKGDVVTVTATNKKGEEVTFEGYGPGGIAVMVESMTDNNNRTVAEVRHAFTKSGGNLGTNGSVAYLFEKKGLIRVQSGQNEDLVMELAIDAGAEDMEVNEDTSMSITSSPEDFENIKNVLADKEIIVEDSEVSFIPENTIKADLDTSLKVFKLLESLEDLDDTQAVTSNVDFSDEMLEHLD